MITENQLKKLKRNSFYAIKNSGKIVDIIYVYKFSGHNIKFFRNFTEYLYEPKSALECIYEAGWLQSNLEFIN